MTVRLPPGAIRLDDAIDPLLSLEKLSLLIKKENLTWYPGKNGIATATEFIDSVEALHPLENIGFRSREEGGDVVFIRAVVL